MIYQIKYHLSFLFSEQSSTKLNMNLFESKLKKFECRPDFFGYSMEKKIKGGSEMMRSQIDYELWYHI